MASAFTLNSVADSSQARAYNRIRRWLGVGDFLLGIGLLAALLATGWSGALRDFSYRIAYHNYDMALCFYVVLLLSLAKMLGFGLDYYGFRVEHRFHLSNQRTFSWLLDEVKGFVLGGIIAVLLAELIYYFIRQYSEDWWVITWASFLVFFILMAQLAPVILFPIFYKFSPLEDEDLKARLLRLSEKSGTRIRGVYKWNLSEKSKKANAALTGLGSTRRIILADTLLDNYSGDEIEAVLAHELGHHVHRHILKSIAVQAITTFAGFWAADQALHYSVDHMHAFETLSDFANLPLLALVATTLSFLLMPALNGFSRFNERQADRYAFQSIPSIDPFVTSMNKLASQNLSERTPAKLVEWFFHSHPSVSQRVQAAQAWSESNSRVL